MQRILGFLIGAFSLAALLAVSNHRPAQADRRLREELQGLLD